MEDGPPIIPKNFANLPGMETSKTSVRRLRDYPILEKRFQDASGDIVKTRKFSMKN